MPTNCSSERSFSKLKHIKNYLSASMSQDLLNSRAIMSLESDLLDDIDYSTVVDEFAEVKSRRVKL